MSAIDRRILRNNAERFGTKGEHVESKQSYLDSEEKLNDKVLKTINKLSGVIEHGKSVLPSEETKELVEEIANQIDTLMKQEVNETLDLNALRKQKKISKDTTLPEDQGEMANETSSSEVMLPARPTPYELWSRAHEMVTFQGAADDLDASKPAPLELSNAAWDDLITRLSDSSKQKHISLMRAETKAVAESLASQSFNPVINEKSKKLAQVIPPLQQRIQFVIKAKQDKIAKQKKQLQERELQHVTGVPQTNTATTTWVPRVQNNYTNNHSSIAEAKLREEAELTFSPRINPNSVRMSERAYRRMMENPKRFAVTGTSKDPGHEEETFHPRINKRSKKLPRPAGSVHQRLFQKAKPQVKPNKCKNNRQEVSQKALDVNVVEYDQSCDFLLRIVHGINK